jgi:hypothetical protein
MHCMVLQVTDKFQEEVEEDKRRFDDLQEARKAMEIEYEEKLADLAEVLLLAHYYSLYKVLYKVHSECPIIY